jgi:hypothetical protein
VGSVSYYFTLFKRLQVLGRVPDGQAHGSGAGGFNLNNPGAVFGALSKGPLLGLTTDPADSPLWAILRSRAQGNPGFSQVLVGGAPWLTMPGTDLAAWDEFQMDAPEPKLVTALGDWITAGKLDDTPDAVLAQLPPPVSQPTRGIRLFACNMPGDDGVKALPAHYWNTSLISLVDPSTGATVDPPQLAASETYNLTAVVGNRGALGAGRYLADAGPKIECEASAMVWNTGFGPAVKLPALSNLDPDTTQPVHELFYLKARAYDIAGFRLPVQTVFDGLVKAIEASEVDLGGLTATEWIHAKHAHLCVRVAIRHAGESWPQQTDTPLQSRRVAQRNLAPFAIDLAVEDPEPNIEWTHFMLGDAPWLAERPVREAVHRLSIEATLDQPLELYLALPRRSFEELVDREASHGFELDATVAQLPVPKAVVLRCSDECNALSLPGLRERRFAAASMGIGFSRSELRRGSVGRISVIQRSTARAGEASEAIVGGFTVELTAM